MLAGGKLGRQEYCCESSGCLRINLGSVVLHSFVTLRSTRCITLPADEAERIKRKPLGTSLSCVMAQMEYCNEFPRPLVPL